MVQRTLSSATAQKDCDSQLVLETKHSHPLEDLVAVESFAWEKHMVIPVWVHPRLLAFLHSDPLQLSMPSKS